MQPVRFCSQPDCYEVAIKGARADDKCRGHYRELLAQATDLVRCTVTTQMGKRGESSAVTDCITNADVEVGGVVTLDPLETNIAALVAGGIVKVVPPAKPAKVKE